MPSDCVVLVVEDHADSREMLAQFLSSCGFTVVTAADGAEALSRAHALRPQVVLMDLSLPGAFDGWDAIRRLKADPVTNHTVVVAITGWVSSRAHERAIRAGARGVLLKPVDLESLAEQVKELCAESASRES